MQAGVEMIGCFVGLLFRLIGYRISWLVAAPVECHNAARRPVVELAGPTELVRAGCRGLKAASSSWCHGGAPRTHLQVCKVVTTLNRNVWVFVSGGGSLG